MDDAFCFRFLRRLEHDNIIIRHDDRQQSLIFQPLFAAQRLEPAACVSGITAAGEHKIRLAAAGKTGIPDKLLKHMRHLPAVGGRNKDPRRFRRKLSGNSLLNKGKGIGQLVFQLFGNHIGTVLAVAGSRKVNDHEKSPLQTHRGARFETPPPVAIHYLQPPLWLSLCRVKGCPGAKIKARSGF